MNETKTTAVPDTKSWAFWRKRLARAAFVGGLALAAAEFLPALPKEQRFVFEAPGAKVFTDLSVSFRPAEEDAAISGMTLHPSRPADTLTHTAKLSDGPYVLEVAATLIDRSCPGPGCPEQKLLVERRVELRGETTRVKLTRP